MVTDGGDELSSPPHDGTDWRDGVVYQIYPRSFADHDGDGTGDLAGIVDRLDYFGPGGLQIEAIWLSPIYPSPGRDLGYDVTDHARVDPLSRHRGRLRPARRRSPRSRDPGRPRPRAEPHERRARLVPRVEGVAARDPTPTSTCGAIRPAGTHDGQPLPPNNWVSFFGGPGWEWVPERGQFYYHTFLVGQPELNWRNPAVEAAQWAMIRGWLARGVDGFRLDVFNALYKDAELRANPVIAGDTAWSRHRAPL